MKLVKLGATKSSPIGLIMELYGEAIKERNDKGGENDQKTKNTENN